MLPRPTRTVNRARTRAPTTPGQPSGLPRGFALERELDAFHATLTGWHVQRNYADPARGRKGQPDYTAVPAVGEPWTHASGRTYYAAAPVVLFDAKSTFRDRWPISLLAPHQAVAFQRIADLGHVAGVYLRVPSGDWWLPWADLAEGWRGYYAGREAFYPVPRWRVEGMNWPATVARIENAGRLAATATDAARIEDNA